MQRKAWVLNAFRARDDRDAARPANQYHADAKRHDAHILLADFAAPAAMGVVWLLATSVSWVRGRHSATGHDVTAGSKPVGPTPTWRSDVRAPRRRFRRRRMQPRGASDSGSKACRRTRRGGDAVPQ